MARIPEHVMRRWDGEGRGVDDARGEVREGRAPRQGTLDVEHLRFFRVLLETGALCRTAERLSMSHAGASRALERLREIFGDRLFHKGGTGMTPTPRALALAPRLARALAGLEELLAPECFDPAVTTRAFRVGALDVAFVELCRRVVPTFVQEAPNATLDIRPLDRDLFAALEDGRLDLALHPGAQAPADFHSTAVAEGRVVCLARPGHPLVRADKRDAAAYAAAFARCRRVVVSVQDGSEVACLDEDAGLAPRPGGVALSTPYLVGACAALQRTDLVLLLPDALAEGCAQVHGLVLLPTPVPARCFHVHLVWHHRVQRDPGVAWLRRLVTEGLAGDVGARATPHAASAPRREATPA